MRTATLFALFVLTVTESACDNKKAEAASGATPAAVVASGASPAAVPATKDSVTKISKVVFVGKEHACDCTRKKVDTALGAIKQVLGEPPRIPVEMLKADTEEEKVAPYRKQKPMMAIPAIYLVDGKDSVLDLLQGEVTVEQIRHALEQG